RPRPRRLHRNRGVPQRHGSLGVRGLHAAGEQSQHAPAGGAAARRPVMSLMRRVGRSLACALMAGWIGALPALAAGPDPPQYVAVDKPGRLAYAADRRGARVPDFSHAGYGGGGVAIPDVPARVVVSPARGDAGARIQAAIDRVSALPPDARGFRGAVLLT